MLSTLLEVVGLCLIVAGVAAWSVPAALVAAGVVLVAWSEFGAGGEA